MDQLIEAMRAQIAYLDGAILRNRNMHRDYVADLYASERAGVQWSLEAACNIQAAADVRARAEVGS